MFVLRGRPGVNLIELHEIIEPLVLLLCSPSVTKITCAHVLVTLRGWVASHFRIARLRRWHLAPRAQCRACVLRTFAAGLLLAALRLGLGKHPTKPAKENRRG